MRLSVTNARHLSIFEEIKKSGGKVDSGEPNDSVLLIDGLNTFIRVFSAIPTTNEDGVHIGGIVGFLRSIGYTINMVRPTRTIIVFDGKGGSNRRRKIFPQYKMGRKMSHRLNRTHDFLTREEEKKMMIFQLNRIVEYLECLPVTLINMDGIEADDVIGYCAKHIFDNKSTIMSTDKDFLQLIDENIRVYSPTKKKMYDEEKVVEEYGISSHNFLLYRMLDGDVSDGIPGIKGVGLKSLLKYFPFLENSHKYTKGIVDASYSMYLFHMPFNLLFFYAIQMNLDLNLHISYILQCTLLFVSTYLLHHKFIAKNSFLLFLKLCNFSNT